MLRAALYLLAFTDPYRYERLELAVYGVRRFVQRVADVVLDPLADVEEALNDIATAAGNAADGDDGGA